MNQITGHLQHSGKIRLFSDNADWEPLILGQVKEFFSKALLEIRPTEEVEVDLVIKKIFPPGSTLEETFINVTTTDEELNDGLQICYNLLKNFFVEDMWMFKGSIIDGERHIPIFIAFFPKVEKTLYVLLTQQIIFFPNHAFIN